MIIKLILNENQGSILMGKKFFPHYIYVYILLPLMVVSDCNENELLLSVLILPSSPKGKPVGDNFGFLSAKTEVTSVINYLYGK
jgi:hypothetical protein